MFFLAITCIALNSVQFLEVKEWGAPLRGSRGGLKNIYFASLSGRIYYLYYSQSSTNTTMSLNSKSSAVKRIMADVRELGKHPSSRYQAQPLEENVFEWHFTIKGPAGSDFENGIYHGRILLPSEYPFKPPNIIFLTKNGRFEVGTKICLSISAYHPEAWQPAWGIRTMLEAIISFLPSEGNGAIGALDWTPDERRRLASESHSFNCPLCGKVKDLMLDPESVGNSDAPDADIAAQISQLHMHNVGVVAGNASPSACGAKASVGAGGGTAVGGGSANSTPARERSVSSLSDVSEVSAVSVNTAALMAAANSPFSSPFSSPSPSRTPSFVTPRTPNSTEEVSTSFHPSPHPSPHPLTPPRGVDIPSILDDERNSENPRGTSENIANVNIDNNRMDNRYIKKTHPKILKIYFYFVMFFQRSSSSPDATV